MKEDTQILYRPTGPKELKLVKESGYRKWPPRLPGQPIFYPVTNQEYAAKIAKDWNVPESGAGYVTRFEVKKSFMDKYEIHQVGSSMHTEWWIPADDLIELNNNIVDTIEVILEFKLENNPIRDYVLNYKEDDALQVMFNWNGKHSIDFVDHNQTFRKKVLDYYEIEPEIFPVELVVVLYEAETELAKEAWGVNRIVSDLASDILERGGVKYITQYLKGWGRGFDASLQSKNIRISQECVLELIEYLKKRKPDDEFPNKEVADFALCYFEQKLNPSV